MMIRITVERPGRPDDVFEAETSEAYGLDAYENGKLVMDLYGILCRTYAPGAWSCVNAEIVEDA
jgi:hypothetical protein